MFAKLKKELIIYYKMLSFVIRTEKKDCLFVAMICLITSLMNPILLEVNYKIISNVESNQKNIILIVVLILSMIIVSGIFQMINYSNLLLFEKLHINIGTKIMNNIYFTCSKLPHSYYDNPDNIANLKRIILFSQDSLLTQNTVHIISFTCNLISLILIFPVLYRAGVEIFIIIFIISVIINIFNFNDGYKRWEHERNLEKENIKCDKIKSYFHDKTSVMEIRMLNTKNNFQNKWIKLNNNIQNKNFIFEKKIEGEKVLFKILSVILRTVPLIYITFKYSFGLINISVIFLVWQSNEQFINIMSKVFDEIKATHYSVPYISEIFHFLKNEKTLNQKRLISKNNNADKLIELKNVYFSYNDKFVLNDINLDIYNGEKIAIIGANGAGKTTLIKILSNLYMPTKGEIKYYINTGEFGIVWQDFVNFELTLKESIGLGYIEEINNKNKILELINTIDLDITDIGIDDVIGKSFDNDGKIPSGGQWQKIAIARSLYGEKSIIFMDEPTASLDPISEVNLYKKINKIFKDKTVLFVSHRIGFANLADRIIVLSNGKIIENGNHNDLIKNKGYYYNFYNEQLKWYNNGEE